MFRVIPAVDLKGGKVVRLVQGREDAVTFQTENPVEVAEMWVKKGARCLHVIDLDGAFRGKLRHEDIICEILNLPVEVQVGGGLRDLKIAERLLAKGAERVILGTIAVEKVSEVRRFAKEWKRRVMVAIDAKKGKVAVRGWRDLTDLDPVELAKLYDDLEVSFLYTNIDVEGLVAGINTERIARVVEELKNPVYVAGGISSVNDIRTIKKLGAAGVVIGSALYTGKLKFEDALKVEYEEV